MFEILKVLYIYKSFQIPSKYARSTFSNIGCDLAIQNTTQEHDSDKKTQDTNLSNT